MPSAIVLPWSSTWIRSQSRMIRRMSCSITSRPTPNVVPDRGERADELVRLGLVEPGGGLVEQQEATGAAASARAIARRRCSPCGSAPAARPARCSRPQASQELARSSARACRREAPFETAAGLDVLEDRQAREEADVLERPHEPGARDLGRLPGRDVLAVEHDASGRRPLEAGEHVDERRLARRRSGRSGRGSRPRRSVEVDAVDGLHAADVDPDVPRLEGFRRNSHSVAPQ